MSTPPAGPPVDPSATGGAPVPAPVCPRHPDRVSYVSCQRCGRPACYECQRDAAVGKQCVDCVREAARTAPVARTRFGAPARAGAPVVTWTLIGLCVLAYAGQWLDPRVTRDLSFVGVLAGTEPWRFLTSAFVHSPTSVLHILFNMYVLYAFGPPLEQAFGRARYLLAYLLSAVGGSVGVLWLSSPDPGWYIPVVGASGAIFGLLLLHLVLTLAAGRNPTSLLTLLAINLALPLVAGGIAWQAHIGGALTGAAVGGLMVLSTRRPSASLTARRGTGWSWAALAAVGVVLVVLAVLRIWQVMGVEGFTGLQGITGL